jgi:sortase A
VRTALRGVGRTLIGTGVLILLFVAYQLWGTNLAEARSQKSLKHDFLASLPSTSVAPPTTTAAPGTASSVPATTAPPDTFAPPPPAGEAVAIIKIPKIGLEKAVVEGTGVPDLKKGPGHYIGTPMPGQPGNAAIAGHRTTYGAPFNRIDELQPGDPIIVTTRQGSFRYEMAQQEIVKPSDVHVLNPTPDNRLTLTSCNPKYSARQRIVVVARLVGAAAPAPPPEAVSPTTTAPPSSVAGGATTIVGGDSPVVSAPARSTSIEGGLSGEGAANGPAIFWGLLAAAVFVAVWVWSRVWRRWPAYLLGAPVFLVVLFVFFENVSRLLPANI